MRSVFNKILSGAIVLIALFHLWSCNTYQIDEEKVGKHMEGVLTQLFNAVQLRDKDTFQTFFADHVVSLPDFEAGWDYVIDQYQGNLMEVKFRSTGYTGEHIVPKDKIHYAYMTFIVITSEAEYMVRVEFYTKYASTYPNDSYKIRKFSLLSKLENGDFEDDGMGFTQRYGIYYPGWINEKID